MSTNQTGFTLIELVTVIVIASIIFVYVGSNAGQPGLELRATRDDVVTGLGYAQQIAMARQAVANPVSFVSDGISTIDIQENGASIAGDIYPLTLPANMSLTALNISYDKLGRTTSSVLTLTSANGSATVTVEDSGYTH
jgi:MSHA pilin protein MshC